MLSYVRRIRRKHHACIYMHRRIRVTRLIQHRLYRWPLPSQRAAEPPWPDPAAMVRRLPCLMDVCESVQLQLVRQAEFVSCSSAHHSPRVDIPEFLGGARLDHSSVAPLAGAKPIYSAAIYLKLGTVSQWRGRTEALQGRELSGTHFR